MSNHVNDLTVGVIEIQGHCPVYQVGDQCQIHEGYKLAAGRACYMRATAEFHQHLLQFLARCYR